MTSKSSCMGRYFEGSALNYEGNTACSWQTNVEKKPRKKKKKGEKAEE